MFPPDPKALGLTSGHLLGHGATGTRWCKREHGWPATALPCENAHAVLASSAKEAH